MGSPRAEVLSQMDSRETEIFAYLLDPEPDNDDGMELLRHGLLALELIGRHRTVHGSYPWTGREIALVAKMSPEYVRSALDAAMHG